MLYAVCNHLPINEVTFKMKTPKELIDKLRAQLHEHNYNYYILSEPEISDFEFDALMKQLSDLEAQHPEYSDPNSPTKRVGSDINTSFRQGAHRYQCCLCKTPIRMKRLQSFTNV